MPFWVNTIVSLIAFGFSAISGFFIIPYLRKVKAGQTILGIGPKWHKKKEGTPTMGGFIFIIGTIAGIIFGMTFWLSGNFTADSSETNKSALQLLTGLLMALAFMGVGFLDDYIKVVKKRNLGLKAKQKVILQILISAAYLYIMKLLDAITTELYLPIFGNIDFGIFFYPLMIAFIIFIVNSVNLTDGVDGLCSSVTIIACLAFFMIFVTVDNTEYSIFALALSGGCLGFLIWNLNPAKVFMGDTGSMFLGGSMVALSFATGYPVIIILVGIIYICESLSVILQVISFKTTGKRIFKMSPIHHHFEMSGWGEYKIVIVFSLITLLAGSAAVYYIYRLSMGVITLK